MKININKLVKENEIKIKEYEKEKANNDFMIRLYKANIEVLQLECEHDFVYEGLSKCKNCGFIGGL